MSTNEGAAPQASGLDQREREVPPGSADFRSAYLDFAALERQLAAWQARFPELVRLEVLGHSPEGRPIRAAIVGRDPERVRPSVWVDANMHATEFSGTNVALGIVEDVLALHQGEALGLSAPEVERLLDVLFVVVPRMSPDGAEAVLTTGRYVRSSPVDERPNQARSRWLSRDVDGDGVIRVMRRRDPQGEAAESDMAPGLMVPRTPGHPGPYYKLFPEGVIANFDGHTVPNPHYLGDNAVDFNRNFPWSWAPEPEQLGAGDYPGSTPETRAVIEAAVRRPHLFAWLNLHTFGGVLIRPLGHQPDNKMNPGDLAVFRQIEAWTRDHTGYPTVSGFHEFTYEPDKPLRGDLSDYAYHQRGCVAYVIELWDLFREIGMEVKKPFVDHYSHWTPRDFAALAAWDVEKNQGRLFQPWRSFEHPQLGQVELGGVDIRVGISNPPPDRLDDLCRRQSAAFLRVAAMLPRVVLDAPSVRPLGDGIHEVSLVVRNPGYLATYGLPSHRELPICEPLTLRVTADGPQVLGQPPTTLGHLEGWGRGLHSGWGLFIPWTRGSVSEKRVVLCVKGSGRLELAVESCRTGRVAVSVELPSASPADVSAP